MRKYKAIVATLGICTLIAGCTPNNQGGTSGAAADSSGATAQENLESEKEAQDGAGDTKESDEAGALQESNEAETSADRADASDAAENSASKALFDDLLAGNTGISFSYYSDKFFKDDEHYNPADDYIKPLPTDKELTLSDLRDAFNRIIHDNNEDSEGVLGMRYAYIDCGNDGNKEMALEVDGTFIDGDSSLTLILKEIDGTIQTVYAYANWARSQTDINEYGFISGGGSNSASNHGYNASYIDADGNYSFGYYEGEELDFDMFTAFKEHEDYDTSGLDGSLCIYELRLDEKAYDEKDYYYSYIVVDKDTYQEINVPNLYTDSEYKKIIDGIKDCNFVTMEEYTGLKEDKLKSIGVTDEIKGADYPEYTEIDSITFDSSTQDAKGADAIPDDGSIRSELAKVEAKYQEYESMDWGAMDQSTMNITSGEMFTLWDDELNSIWGRITENVSSSEKEKLLTEQREWIKKKEAKVKEAGKEAEGGTLQPLLESGTACRITRKRVYHLATVLAKALGEDYTIPSEVEESFEPED